jgi:hypothetical protein
MATIKELSYILSIPGVPGGKNYKTELNVETGATVTYDVTAPFQKDAVLRSDPVVSGGLKVYSNDFVPDKDGNIPSGADALYLLTIVRPEADKQRANFYLREAPQTGKDLDIPGVINTAPDPGSPTPGSPTPGSPTDAITLENLGSVPINIIPVDKSVKKHGNYQYPLVMPDDMDKIKFTMIEYRGTNLKSNKLGFENKFDRETGQLKLIGEKKLLGTVTMGIQPRISDRNSVSWGDIDANTLGLLGGAASLQLISQGAEGVDSLINKIGNTIEAEKDNITSAVKLEIAGAAASISGLVSRVAGGILNPNLELLFDGPQLRPFDFTFQLTPRDDKEAKQVKQIIRFFKQGMAVQRTAAELFLKTPNVFNINYMFGQKEDHPGLNKIKTCALQSFNVDYTPTGSYMTFSDGTMTAYNITLSFKELEPVYSDQYQDPNDNETVDSVRIGF